jgi:hypothetical protein
VNRCRSLNVVLHFHGGLVPETDAIKEHERLGKLYGQAGYLPVFCVWRTGALEIIRDNYLKIASSVLFQTIFDWSMRCLVGFNQAGKGIGKVAPKTVLDSGFKDACSEFDSITKVTQPFSSQSIQSHSESELRYELTIVKLINDDKSWLTRDFQDCLNPNPNQGKAISLALWMQLAKSVAKICMAVWTRKNSNRDHGLHATLIEEIIREFSNEAFRNAIWLGIKDKAKNMVSPDGTCGLLVQMLSNEASNLSLVGHSAGSIPICYLAKEKELKIDNIVLFAPACRSDLFLDALQLNQKSLKRLRIFTMSDELEKADPMLKNLVLGARYVYPRSLLYFVSGVLEKEADDRILGMHRFMQEPFNTTDDLRLQESLAGKMVLSKSLADARPGFRCHAESHTDFFDDPLTRESFLHILRGKK